MAPLVVVVSVEIEPARRAAFLAAMQIDVAGSRLEPGCLRFDLLQDVSSENKYVFYEAYTDTAAHAAHKLEPHYKVWADFKAEGGVVSQSAVKAAGVDFTAAL